MRKSIYNNFMSQISIYKKFLKQRHIRSYKFLNVSWAVFGTTTLYILALFEPWSKMLFEFLFANGVSLNIVNFVVMPLIMLAKALILIEAIGYFYHRFAEHLGFLTRLSNQIRKNQANHWKHHMVDYPIGSYYIRNKGYQKSQSGIPWEWAFPGFLTIVLVIVFWGIVPTSAVFLVFAVLYALMFAKTHARFHEKKNPWAESKYFKWLEDIHKVHHWDQATNYGITNPIYDILFGTYVSPKKHSEFLKESKQKHKLYTSDLINWHYMVHFAWPKTYTLQVSNLKKDKNQKLKFHLILNDLQREFKKNNEDILLSAFLNRIESINSSIIKI